MNKKNLGMTQLWNATTSTSNTSSQWYGGADAMAAEMAAFKKKHTKPEWVDTTIWSSSYGDDVPKIAPIDPLSAAVFQAYALKSTGYEFDQLDWVSGQTWKHVYRKKFLFWFGKERLMHLDVQMWFEENGYRAEDEDDRPEYFDIAAGACVDYDSVEDDIDTLVWCDECCMPCYTYEYEEEHERCEMCAEDRMICQDCGVSFYCYDGYTCSDCDGGGQTGYLCEGCAVYSEDADDYFCSDHYEEHNDGDGPMSDRMGESTTAPWEKPGVVVQITLDEDADYRDIWDFHVEHLDPATGAADFYLLETVENLIHLPAMPGWSAPSELRVIAGEAKEIRAELVATYDDAFRKYCDIAIGGEIRYHRAMSGRWIPGRDRTRAWAGWKAVRDEIGPQALLDVAKLFREMGHGSVGGNSWATASEILHARVTGKISAVQFVDRVFTLAHNGGAFLNKIGWGGWFRINHEVIRDTLGPAHANHPTQYGVLLHFSNVRSLFNDYVRLVNQARRSHGLRPIFRDLGISEWKGGIAETNPLHYLRAEIPYWAFDKNYIRMYDQWKEAHANA